MENYDKEVLDEFDNCTHYDAIYKIFKNSSPLFIVHNIRSFMRIVKNYFFLKVLYKI